MIAAGFLPRCPAAWHSGVHALITAGWWHDAPAASLLPSTVWLALPAALVTVMALAVSRVSLPAFIVVLGGSALVQPWLPLVLAPLMALTTRGPWSRSWRVAAICGGTIFAMAVWVAPDCEASPAALSWTAFARATATALGLPALLLVGFDLAAPGPDGRRRLWVALALVAVAATLATFGLVDGATAIGAGAVALWERALAGGIRVLGWQNTGMARAGTTVLLLLVPLLAIEPLTRTVTNRDPSTAEVWEALDGLTLPAAVVATGGRADAAAVIWRAGHEDRRALTIRSLPAVLASSASGALYVWPHVAADLQRRGYVVGRLDAPDDAPTLWRVLDAVACEPLTTAWVDVGNQAAGGRIAGIFPLAAPLRGALVYVSSRRPLAPHPVDWPADGIQGFDVRQFDREEAADLDGLTDAAARDELDLGAMGDARFLARIRFDRRGTSPQALTVSLGGAIDAARARLYSSENERADRRPSICRDTQGQVVTAFEGAPSETRFDVTSSRVTGSGWAEALPDGRRWMEGGDAELFFLADQVRPLRLVVDAREEIDGPPEAGLRVSLNGVAAQCLEGSPPCDWLLPAEAVRRGHNVLTLHVDGNGTPDATRRTLIGGVRLSLVRVAR